MNSSGTGMIVVHFCFLLAKFWLEVEDPNLIQPHYSRPSSVPTLEQFHLLDLHQLQYHALGMSCVSSVIARYR